MLRKYFKPQITAARRAAAFCFLLVSAIGSQASELIPMQAWVHDPVIDSVEVNPSGNRMAALTLNDVQKPPEISIWNMDNMQAAPLRVSLKKAKPLALTWLSDRHLMVFGRRLLDRVSGGKVVRWFNNEIYVVTLHESHEENLSKPPKEKLIDLGDDIIAANVENFLPKKPNKILLSVTNLEFASDLYEMDLDTFRLNRTYRASPKRQAQTDPNGEVISKVEFHTGGIGARLEYYYKNPQSGKFESHHQFIAKEREGLQPVAIAADGRTVYMTDNKGRDKAVIRRYDLLTRELSEPLFGGDVIEAVGVHISSHPKDFGEVVSYIGYGHGVVEEFVSPARGELQAKIENALGRENQPQVVSMSDDWNKIIVQTSGVKEPGAFYLLLNQEQMVPLGRQFPGLKPELLSDMKYVEYNARDGLTIPAYLTTPKNAEPPYPAIVMPHGGPWARDFLGWDQWAQFLANRGYAVLQPQYRGSEGWGHKLWRAGDGEWGQKMQDDKDDGAAWMVEQGIASKDRIAIYGYSYGGYAAMAAIVRPNSPYQCAISGAGLAELRSFDKVTFTNPFQRDFQNPTIDGLSPFDHVKEASIPIYIFHGDRDQRVPVIQSQKYYRALKSAGKDVQYNEIPDLWHSLPWWPTHHVNVLENLERYLAEDCGPGGL